MDNYKSPKPEKIYLSPSLSAFGQKDRKVRIATKLIESPDTYAFATIKEELVLRHREGAKNRIEAKFFEDDRGIFVLSIQGYTVATEKPHNASFAFVGEEISKLLEFVANIRSMELNRSGAINIADDEIRRTALSRREVSRLIEENEELFTDFIRSSLTKEDIVAVGYRKNQLEVFRSLLEDPDYFERAKTEDNCTDEQVWQRFFQRNTWIFGYGLNYIYLDALRGRRLEQTVQGHFVGGPGKRTDALMRSRGAVSSLCFVEIKTHKTPLLAAKPYRTGCWSPSTELAGGVSQVQGTVRSAMNTVRDKLALTNSEGQPLGEEAYNFSPKAYLVIGSLGTYVSNHGVNEQQFRSFELFRRNTLSPEIITFDELYERARFIVHQNEA